MVSSEQIGWGSPSTPPPGRIDKRRDSTGQEPLGYAKGHPGERMAGMGLPGVLTLVHVSGTENGSQRLLTHAGETSLQAKCHW